MKFCTNCGAQLSDQTKFCSNCGQKIEQAPVMPVQPVQPVDADIVSQKPLYTPPTPPVQPVEAPKPPVAPVQQSITPPAPPVQQFEAPKPPVAPVQQPITPPAPPVQQFEAPKPPVAPVQQPIVPPAPPAPPVQQYEAPKPPAAPVQQPIVPPAPPAPPVQQYEAPKPPMAPVQQPIAPPAPPVQPIEAPKPPVAPVQQPITPPAPPAQQFEAPKPPMAPVQQPIAPPAPPAQSYAPPAPPAPPAQSYAPPAPPAQNYAAPSAPAAAKKPAAKKSKLPLFLGIGAVVILLIVGIIVLTGGGGNDLIGRYECVSLSMMGMEFKGEDLKEFGDCWLELKEDGKCTMMLMDEKVKGTWSADGEELTFEIDGEEAEAVVEDGVLTMTVEEEGVELVMVFEKEGGKSAEKTDKPDAPVAKEAEEVGYWTLQELKAEDPEEAMSAEDVKLMKGWGMEVFLNLAADGTGEGSFFMSTHIKWGDGKIEMTDLYMTCTYTLEGGQLILMLPEDGSQYVFVPGEGEAPKVDFTEPATAAPTEAAGKVDYEWWVGDWYGWWIVTNATGEYTDAVDDYWDAYARIEKTGENTGRLIFWDEEFSYEGALGNVEIEFDEGWSEKGCFVSVKGEFNAGSIGYYDWLVDPAMGPVSEFDNMIGIEGIYVDPENEANTFEYVIILRPWGLDWEDVAKADTSNSLYEDMLPAYYADWYLPLLEKGVDKMPNSKAEGEELLK